MASNDEGSPKLTNRLETWRLLVFVAVIGLIFLAFIAKLFSMQILQYGDWTAKALNNSVRTENIPALRGIIYDRNGIILARNIASYNVSITASLLPDDPGATQEIFRQLSNIINMPVNKGDIQTDLYVPCNDNLGIAQIAEFGLESEPYVPVKVKCDIDETTARVILEKAMDWPGVSVDVQPIRDYPTSSITASLIGFLGPIPAEQEADYRNKNLVPNRDKVGYAGLERQYQDLLAGKNGIRQVQVDVGGKALNPISPPELPVPGKNLQLTIDTRLQEAATEILKTELDRWNRVVNDLKKMSVGAVVAINPKTGEILAMVSYPTYENNRMARLIPSYYYEQLVKDPTNPLLNHAVGDRLPVGSVFKLVTGTGALNEGVVTPDQIIETPGILNVKDKFYANAVGTDRPLVDWIYQNGKHPEGFGKLDFVHGLAFSSNMYFYKLGGGYQDEVPNGGLGICRLGTYAAALGYGEAPGIYLPDEQSGLIPTPQWKRVTRAESWSSGDTYISSVGQGYVLGTPIQVLLSASILANNGKFMQPTLVKEVLDGEGNVVPEWIDQKGDVYTQPISGTHQLSPFQPYMKWDITKDNVIKEYNQTSLRGCEEIKGQTKNVAPWVIQKVKEGMRLAVTDGTLSNKLSAGVGFEGWPIAVAGKTGTAEFCDKYALAQNRCGYGNWPSHAWTVAFAPYDDPEIAVVSFVYNGNEGSTVSGPIVRKVLQSYFELKAMDNAAKTP